MKGLPYYLALLIEVLVFHRRVLFSRGFLFPWDFRAVHLPLATFVADSFRRGEMPLWDPFTYCGNPIFANIQTALFYPPVLIATLASLWFGSASLPWLLEVAMVLQIFFSGVCTFVLLKRIGVQPAAAWIGATIYELGCFFASQAEHMGAVHGASWLPFAWLCVIELRSRFRWIWLAALSLALSMTVLAGLPQVAVAVFGSVVLLSLVLAAFRLARWTLPLQVLISWLWALLLAAMQVIPTRPVDPQQRSQISGRVAGRRRRNQTRRILLPGDSRLLECFRSLEVPWPLRSNVLVFVFQYCGPGSGNRRDRLETETLDASFRGHSCSRLAIWMLGDSTPIGRVLLKLLPPSIRIGIHPEFTLCVFSLALALIGGNGSGPSATEYAAASIGRNCDRLRSGDRKFWQADEYCLGNRRSRNHSRPRRTAARS